jgi:peptide/nickel transport system ATP-binding protein
MALPEDVLTVKDLKAYYQMAYFGVEREVRAVDEISLSVRRNEVYGIAGESSSGKTTLIKTFAAAIRPPLRIVDGSVTFHFTSGDIDLYAAGKGAVDAIRWKHLSYIMQGSMSLLNPVRRVRTAFEDFAMQPMGLPKNEFWGRVEAHLKRLELSPHVLSAYPHQLSGGMRQRVVIALATVCQPDFVIADEPTTALDVVVQKDVLAMIRDVQREMRSSVVFVTHDMSVHANIADRVGIMYAGRLVEEGPTRTLFAAPRHPYTAHLVAALPRIGDTTPKAALEGRPPNLAEPPAGCRFHPRCPLAIEKCQTEVPPLETVGPDHRSACWRSADVRPLARLGTEEPVVVR